MTDTTRRIFISYRRDDNKDFVEHIRAWFIFRYGRENVFMDFDSIPPITRFADFIQDKVRESDVLIAIIGPRWIELMRDKAARFQEDYVRIEIELALKENKLVAPICIKGASVPSAEDLPSDLCSMLDYNAAHLNSGTAFLDNIERIMDAIEYEFARRRATEYLERGNQKIELGDFDGSRAEFDEAIRLNPQFAEAYRRRGDAHCNKGDWDMAIADYNEAIHLNPQNAQDYRDRGHVFQYGKKDLDAAIGDYTEAIRLDPPFFNAHFDRAGAWWYGKGDLDAAIADYNELIRLNPQIDYLYEDRANIYYEKGDYDKYIVDYTEYIRLAPEKPDGYYSRGIGYFAKGDYDGATADFTQACTLASTEPRYFVAQAVAIHAQGQVQKAVKLWGKLAEQDRRYEDADWVEQQIIFPEPMAAEARKLIARL